MRRVAVGIAVAIALAGCSGGAADAQSAAASTAITLPDGSTATPTQTAYLNALKPSMSDEHNRDVLGLLNEGQSICRINATEDWVVGVLKGAGYTITEAIAMNTEAHKHLCPS